MGSSLLWKYAGNHIKVTSVNPILDTTKKLGGIGSWVCMNTLGDVAAEDVTVSRADAEFSPKVLSAVHVYIPLSLACAFVICSDPFIRSKCLKNSFKFLIVILKWETESLLNCLMPGSSKLQNYRSSWPRTLQAVARLLKAYAG